MNKMEVIEELKSVFPLEFLVTKEIIEKSNIFNPQNCIGSNSLKKALGNNMPKGFVAIWARGSGAVRTDIWEADAIRISIGTKEDIDFMEIKEPTKVTFIIQEQ